MDGMQEARGSSPLSSTSKRFARSEACRLVDIVALLGMIIEALPTGLP
jgi:hypothetical protein